MKQVVSDGAMDLNIRSLGVVADVGEVGDACTGDAGSEADERDESDDGESEITEVSMPVYIVGSRSVAALVEMYVTGVSAVGRW